MTIFDRAGALARAFGRGAIDPLGEALLAAAEAHDLPRSAVGLTAELDHLAIEPEDRLHLRLLAFATLIDLRQGSTRTPLSVEHWTRLFPGLEASRLAAAIEFARSPRAPKAIGAGAPFLVDGDHLYAERPFLLELEAAKKLAPRLVQVSLQPELEAALSSVLARPASVGDRPVILSKEQQDAVRSGASRGLTVITGGPGTGKTSIVGSLLRVLARLGVEGSAIALGAPTGKAAERLGSALRTTLEGLPEPKDSADEGLDQRLPEPQTLHRLLGFQPKTRLFRHHAGSPLPHEVVIIDESSMVGIELMVRLLDALLPEARLVLLGDADQLPSIEAGAVLRDLVKRPDNTVRLGVSHRAKSGDPGGSAILSAAEALREGAPLLPRLVRRTPRALELSGVELCFGEPRRLRAELLDRWSAEARDPELLHDMRRAYLFRDGELRPEDRRSLDRLFAHHRRRQILAITRGDATPTGAAALNQAIHRRHLEELDLTTGHRFAPGEPVIAERNDYQRGLYNGDLGVVVTVAEDRSAAEPMAVFMSGGQPIPFSLGALGELIELAHALTVHKAQGSEYEQVLLFLPETDLPLLTQEILYTAITRAKRGVVIAGDPALVELTASRRLVRHFGLAERL